MSDSVSSNFDSLVNALEARKQTAAERRRNLTKNVVAQTNEESRSGVPYLVDVTRLIGHSNSEELFLEGLINNLRADAVGLGEGMALKRALSSIMVQIKETATTPLPSESLYEIGKFFVDSISSIELWSD